MTVTCDANRVRNVASSSAESPPPTTAIGLPRKKNPSHVAQGDTPCPIRRRSLGTPSSLAEAPVAMMRARAFTTPSSPVTVNGVRERSTAVTLPRTSSAPNRSAWPRIALIKSGPMTPSVNPGKFSTAVVSMSCPPASRPSMTSGFRLARAAYSAAVNPAGPDPMMTTLRVVDMKAAAEPVLANCELSIPSDVPIEHLLQHALVDEADNLIDDLPVLEEHNRGDSAHHIAHGHTRVVI